MHDPRPTRRFSDRVEYYEKYRPGYPEELVSFLQQELELSATSVVADVGSGTGLLARLILPAAKLVIAIEPNPEMRRAAEVRLGNRSGFRSAGGSAEATDLATGSVDLVLAAQAFHWFDRDRARREFSRILRPPRRVGLVWNRRKTETSPFLRAYEDLLQRLSIDYSTVDHRNVAVPSTLAAFFGTDRYREAHFPNEQVLDWDGLQGRVLSSSYAPMPDHPGHVPMMRELRRIFEDGEEDGKVTLEYDTELFWGCLV